MIVKMAKVYIAVRSSDRDRLLDRLRDWGVVHLLPVDAAHAKADEQTLTRIDKIKRALQAISGVAPVDEPPGLSGVEAAEEILDIQRRLAERQNRLATLHHLIEQISVWGNVERASIDRLREAGVQVLFYSLPDKRAGDVRADYVQTVGSLPGKRSLVAAVMRHGSPELPEGAVEVHFPARDAPSIRAEAAQVEADRKQDLHRLAQLAHLPERMRLELSQLHEQADYMAAERGALTRDQLFALQGWAPMDTAPSLQNKLAEAGIPGVVETLEVQPGEEPPTAIHYPAWVKPIEGLFKILGTVPGYREFDVSIPFMIALPIFAAILTSDGGYGLVLLLVPLLFYRKVTRTLGAQFTHLLMVIGFTSFVWGILIGSFFGFGLDRLYKPLVTVNLGEESRTLMMRISFLIGAIHLSAAQLWQAVRLYPDLRFLNRVGWAVFIWGMLGVVHMFVLKFPMGWNTPWPYFLIAGTALAVFFWSPSWNPLKMIGLGVANFPLSMLSAFSDVISYVRLMAVGLAGSVLAVSFNNMAADAKDVWPLALAIFFLGHSLNIGLVLIALFAHGVRLNMLEFCNNLGMQWTGHPYRPFLKRTTQES
ncbi:MAG: hypothetical protein GXY83_30435 [Rhodopirellula sp.]|nr:hypothetical protein [Rhodopirellula sp.]